MKYESSYGSKLSKIKLEVGLNYSSDKNIILKISNIKKIKNKSLRLKSIKFSKSQRRHIYAKTYLNCLRE